MASTRLASYVEAHVETGHEAPDKWGANMITIADCIDVLANDSVELKFPKN
jgi:hypothetical protein